jgi:hypothetical protein
MASSYQTELLAVSKNYTNIPTCDVLLGCKAAVVCPRTTERGDIIMLAITLSQ